MNEYKISIGISKQTRVFATIERVFENIGYRFDFWRKWECFIWDIRFVQVKWPEQISTSIEYWDIDAFIIWSDIAGEVVETLKNETNGKITITELLDLKKSASRFCLLLDSNIRVDDSKKLSDQFDFVITKYPKLAKKYLWNEIIIKKSESDSELLAKRFGVLSFEIVQSWETAYQNKLNILWEWSEVSKWSYLWKIIQKLPKNSIRVFSRSGLAEDKQDVLDDFVIHITSILDAEKYDLISFNIQKENIQEVMKMFPWRQPNILRTNDDGYSTLRTLIPKYWIESIAHIRKIWWKDILVESLRQIYL